MSRKSIGVTVLIIAIIALGVGAYAVAHNSNSNTASGTTTSSGSYSNTPPSSSAPSSQETEQKIGSVLVVKTNSSVGNYLATPSGQALYTYGPDGAGVSKCTGDCLSEWPAYQNTGSTTDLPANVGSIKRTDNGQMQFTYKGMPLYRFASESTGQVTGNNKDSFYIAKP